MGRYQNFADDAAVQREVFREGILRTQKGDGQNERRSPGRGDTAAVAGALTRHSTNRHFNPSETLLTSPTCGVNCRKGGCDP